MTVTNCDIAIIGGGPVGSALAIALQGNDLNVVLLEAREAAINTGDPRSLALSYGSRLLLQRLHAWDTIPNVSGIKTIEVSQKDTPGHTTLNAGEMGVSELGYVLPYTALHAALQQSLQRSDVHCLYGAAVGELNSSAEHTTVSYTHQGNEHKLTARLAVVAE
ncbi:MAG: FAD-dependent monooxygenase, partial [Pseudomonadota bacterium]